MSKFNAGDLVRVLPSYEESRQYRLGSPLRVGGTYEVVDSRYTMEGEVCLRTAGDGWFARESDVEALPRNHGWLEVTTQQQYGTGTHVVLTTSWSSAVDLDEAFEKVIKARDFNAKHGYRTAWRITAPDGHTLAQSRDVLLRHP